MTPPPPASHSPSGQGFSAEPLWRPSAARVEAAAITAFQREVARRFDQPMPDYAALHAWSIADPARFWGYYAEYVDLPLHAPPERVMSNDPMPYTRWFEGARLNYAEALLYPRALPPEGDAATAIVAVTEAGDERSLSYGELRRLVARTQQALVRAGVGEGDRVAAFAANLPETVALLLACAATGAIFSSCSPDFGFDAAFARFGQIQPKLLFATPRYRYGGRHFEVADTVARLAAEIPGLEQVVLLPYPGEETAALAQKVPGAVAFEAWLDELAPAAGAPSRPSFASLPFDHPLYILYSSGTTGLPKAMVHRAGGALLKHHNEHLLHDDIRPGDVVLYFTTCGWMMWNWLVSVLAQGAAIVLFEGSPVHPDPGVLWRLSERHGVTFFGTSARYLHSLDAQGVSPRRIADLSRLRTVASTGSPLSPAGFAFVYREVNEDLHLASISGGTDIVGCFMLGVPTLPVYAGEIQAAALGVDLAAYDEAGRPVIGRPGELVCRQPLPSMPLRFWNDPDYRRYLSAYFETYPGVWRHGDLITITERGGVIVYGRSDATLNPGGVRIGTAEIYRPLEQLPEVLEAAAVGKRQAGDEEIWLFVVLRDGERLTPELEERIRRTIRREASPRHVPKRIFQVSQLPRTRSGKAMEIAVSRLINGQEVPNREVMANPEALDEIAQVIAAA